MRLTAGTIVIVIFAILAGMVGAYVVRATLTRKPVPQVVEQPPVTAIVPLASSDLPVGRTITIGDVALMSMTQAQMTEAGMALDKVMMNPDQIVGRRIRQEMTQGQPFLTTDLFLEFNGPDLTALLKPGQRAYQVELPETYGAGTIREGSVVDVIFRAAPRDGDFRRPAIPETTMTLVEAVEVLAVERPRPAESTGINRNLVYREVDPGDTQNPRVTLAVTLEQAAMLQTVQGRGEILLVPRPAGEAVTMEGTGKKLTLEQLLDIQRNEFETEVYRGVDRAIHIFVDGQLARGSLEQVLLGSNTRTNSKLTSTAGDEAAAP